jgi:hypothetical protein
VVDQDQGVVVGREQRLGGGDGGGGHGDGISSD